MTARYPYLATFGRPTLDGKAGLFVAGPAHVTYVSAEGVAFMAERGVTMLSERSAAKRCRRDVDARSTGAVTYVTLTAEEAALIL